MCIFESQPGKLKRWLMGKTVTKPITRTPEYSNSDTNELNETGATHSYVGKELLEKILSLNYPTSKPTFQSLMVANGEMVGIIGQVVIPILIDKDVKQVSFRLVPKLKSTSILGTDMIKNLKMTLNYDTGSWWLPGSSPTCYHIDSLPKAIIEYTTSDRKKSIKTNKEISNEIMENKINSNNKILTSVNNRIKVEIISIENNTKKSKPKFGGKIQLKNERVNGKNVVGRNTNDFTQTYNDSNLSQKTKNVLNPKANPYKEISSLFSLPTYDRFKILENPTLQTENSNENREDKGTIMTGILYNSKLPEELKKTRLKDQNLEKPKFRTKQPRSEKKFVD